MVGSIKKKDSKARGKIDAVISSATEEAMEEKFYRSWQEFNREDLRRNATLQLSIDELARDVLFDDYQQEDVTEELNFD